MKYSICRQFFCVYEKVTRERVCHATESSGEDWLLFADGACVTFIFGCCGGRALARAAEDNAAVRRNCSGRSLRPAQSAGLQYSRASASPAAEAISDKGRARRRSVKNRRTFSISRGQSRTRSDYAEARKRLRKRTFDCFKSAAGIRFSVGARPIPKSFHRGGFWCYLLSAQKVTHEK